jgi:hypothetical protein
MKLKNICSDIISGTADVKNIQSINMHSIVQSINKLSAMYNLDSLYIPESMNDKSFPLVVSYNNNNSQNLEIYIKESGDKHIIPTNNANLTNISTDSITEILHYLNNFSTFDNRFMSLSNQITEEISYRHNNI